MLHGRHQASTWLLRPRAAGPAAASSLRAERARPTQACMLCRLPPLYSSPAGQTLAAPPGPCTLHGAALMAPPTHTSSWKPLGLPPPLGFRALEASPLSGQEAVGDPGSPRPRLSAGASASLADTASAGAEVWVLAQSKLVKKGVGEGGREGGGASACPPCVTEGQSRGVPALSQRRPHLRHLPRGQAWGLEAPQVVLCPARGGCSLHLFILCLHRQRPPPRPPQGCEGPQVLRP